jgi:hypothetical protein
MKRKHAPSAGVVALVLLAGTVAPVAAQPRGDDRLMAAVVSKLPQFVDWPPAAAQAKPTSDFCVAGASGFTADLRELLAGETLKNKPAAVRTVEHTADLEGFQVLFVASGGRGRAGRNPLMAKAATLPILTVSDDPRFLDDGGIVRLRIVDGHYGFDINDADAQRVGLRISSHLLRLAVAVRRGPS